MAPIATDSYIIDTVQAKKDNLKLPAPTKTRFQKAGIDLSNGYVYRPAGPLYLQNAFDIRNETREENSLRTGKGGLVASFRNPGDASRWHTDLVHERQSAGITHLYKNTIPSSEGDTLSASGYSAYEKLSPEFRKIIDGRKAVYRSAHAYLDRNDQNDGPKHIGRIHPIVRLHPAIMWKSSAVD